MAILKAETELTGQAALVPKIIFIETNNTEAQVKAPGYLNALVASGTVLTDGMMALILTKPAPFSKESQTGFYSLSYANGDWTVDGGNGGSFNAKSDYNTTGSWNNTGDLWQWSGLNFDVHASIFGRFDANVVHLADTLASVVQIGNAGSNTTIDATNLKLANIAASTTGEQLVKIDAVTGQLRSSPLANSVTAEIIYFDHATGVCTYGPSGGGAAFDPSFSYTITALLWTINGAFQFNAGFDINAPNEISIVSTGGGHSINVQSTDDNLFLNATTAGMQIQLNADTLNLNSNVNSLYQSLTGTITIQANTIGQQIQIYSDGFNFVCDQQANFNSNNGNVNINANNGSLNMHGNNATFNAITGLGIYTTAGGININTTAGDFNVTVGTGPSSGNINISTQQGTLFLSAPAAGGGINVNNDFNINSTVGAVSLNTNGSNIGVQPTGISFGVSAGAGFTLDSATGDFQFGSGAAFPGGTFLLGTLTNTVTILGHLGIILTSDAGDVQITGATAIKLILPTPAGANNTPLLIDIDGTVHV